MKGLFHPGKKGMKGWRKQGLKTFLSLQEPPSGLIWAQTIEDYWLHQVSQAKYRGAHRQWIYAKVFNREMNLQVPSDLRKPDTQQSSKSREHQMIRTVLLVTFSSLRIFQFLTVRGYRFQLEPGMTEASFLLTCCISSTTSASLLCSGSPNSSVKYTTILKIHSVLTLVFEQQYRFFFTTLSWVYLLLELHLFHFLDKNKLVWQIIWLDSFANKLYPKLLNILLISEFHQLYLIQTPAVKHVRKSLLCLQVINIKTLCLQTMNDHVFVVLFQTRNRKRTRKTILAYNKKHHLEEEGQLRTI